MKPAVENAAFLLIAGYAPSLLGFRASLILSLQQAGWQVHVAAPDLAAGSELRHQLEGKGLVVHDIPLQRTGFNPIADLTALCALWRLMRCVKPQAVLGYTVKPVIYGSLAAWLVGVPRRFALITGLGYAFTGRAAGWRGRLKSVVMGLYRVALGRVHKVFFQNPDDAVLFRSSGLLPVAIPSVVVNGSGVDLSEYAFTPIPTSAGPVRFLLIARLMGDKGVREYAAAAKRIRVEHPYASFAVAGWIDNNPDAITEAELDAWVQGGVLEYLGRLTDVRPAIAEATVYVLPSYREGTPRTVLEAMAMGRPIITTDAPGCRETVVDGENGYLVPVQSVDALVQAMLRFIQDLSLAVLMGQRSRRIAEEKYDVQKVNAVMLKEMGLA